MGVSGAVNTGKTIYTGATSQQRCCRQETCYLRGTHDKISNPASGQVAQQKFDLVTQLLHLIHSRRAEDVRPDGQSLAQLDVCRPQGRHNLTQLTGAGHFIVCKLAPGQIPA